jgi:hypothetical protein
LGKPELIQNIISLRLCSVFLPLISGLAFFAATPTFAEDGGTEFLRFGKPLTAQNPPMPPRKLRRYQDAIARADGPTSCAGRTPDGRIDVTKGIDWGRVGDLFDLEVCLFFAAGELRDVELLMSLLSASGFRGVATIGLAPFESPWVGTNGEGSVLGGAMSISQVPKGFNGPFGTLWAYSLSVGVTLDHSGRPYNSQAIFNYN